MPCFVALLLGGHVGKGDRVRLAGRPRLPVPVLVSRPAIGAPCARRGNCWAVP